MFQFLGVVIFLFFHTEIIGMYYGERPGNCEHPYLLRLKHSNLGHMCGATLVRPTAVITANHCVNEIWSLTDLYVISYCHLNEFGQPQHRQFSKVYRSVDPLHNDIVILELAAPFLLESYVNFPLIPTKFESDQFKDIVVALPGWGETHRQKMPRKLRRSYFYIQSESDCLAQTPKILCGMGVEKKYVSCGGDSGSPFVIMPTTDPADDIIIGVMSGGYGKPRPSNPKVDMCDSSRPSQAVNVAAYLPWINQTLDTIEQHKNIKLI